MRDDSIEEYNPGMEQKALMMFDDMIRDMINNKKLHPVVTELFIRRRKLNISLVFITQSYFPVPKEVKINTTHFFITKIPKKGEVQQIAIGRLSGIESIDFMDLCKKCTA